jgi:hypothetical protein
MAAQTQRSTTNGRARKVPLVSNRPDMTRTSPVASASPAVETSRDEQFELANPLLESADFTQLLSKFIVEHRDDDDAS